MAVPSSAIPERSPGLAPVASCDARLLILGSLPGRASLSAAQYYAHPRNAFWPLVGGVIGRDLVSLPYPDRLEALKAEGVALWDVIASAERPGSLDAAIHRPETSDLHSLITVLPRLRAVAFNGALAAKTGRRLLCDMRGLDLIDLPSSSPAHARPFAEKAEAWSVLDRVLR